jgi:hypothetical protein
MRRRMPRADFSPRATSRAAAVCIEGSGSGWRGRWSHLPTDQRWQIDHEINGFHGRCDGRQDRNHAGQLAALAAVAGALCVISILILAVRAAGLAVRALLVIVGCLPMAVVLGSRGCCCCPRLPARKHRRRDGRHRDGQRDQTCQDGAKLIHGHPSHSWHSPTTSQQSCASWVINVSVWSPASNCLFGQLSPLVTGPTLVTFKKPPLTLAAPTVGAPAAELWATLVARGFSGRR